MAWQDFWISLSRLVGRETDYGYLKLATGGGRLGGRFYLSLGLVYNKPLRQRRMTYKCRKLVASESVVHSAGTSQSNS